MTAAATLGAMFLALCAMLVLAARAADKGDTATGILYGVSSAAWYGVLVLWLLGDYS